MIIEPPPIDYPSQATFVGGFDSSHCSDAVLSGLVLQLDSKKAWKRYVKGALSDMTFVDVTYFERQGRKHLIVAVANLGEEYKHVEDWMSEICETMELWKAEFGGIAILYSGTLRRSEI